MIKYHTNNKMVHYKEHKEKVQIMITQNYKCIGIFDEKR